MARLKAWLRRLFDPASPYRDLYVRDRGGYGDSFARLGKGRMFRLQKWRGDWE